MESITPQASIFNVSLEAARLEAMSGTYPDTVREDAIWLGNFVRDQCARNLDILVHKTRKLGFPTDKTTFSKILRGRYHTDAEGAPTTPCISARNFNQLVDALRSEAKHIWLAGKTPFIETDTWRDIEAYVTTKRAPETICKFGLIIGHTGSQKTSCLKRYVALNNSGRCIHLEAPEKPTMGRFVRELGKAFGIPEKVSGEKLRLRINDNINERKCIIVDNIQRLYKPNQGWNQEIFNYLQKVQDDTSCTIILCSIPDFERTLSEGTDRGYFEQFVGRVGGRREFLRLPDYAPREDVLAIAEAYGLKDPEAHIAKLEALARQPGRIRILFNTLQKAKRLADAAKRPLAMKHVSQALDEEEAE